MSSPSANLDLQWIEDLPAIAGLAPDWRTLAQETGADIYMTPDWLLTWWKHFGDKRKLMCLVARAGDDNTLVGVLPFMIDRIRIGPISVRVARLAATDPHAILFSLPVRPADLHPMLSRAFGDLLDARRCADMVSFTPASEEGPLPAAIQAFGKEQDARGLLIHDQVTGSHTMFRLPDSFDGYLASLSKKRRSQFRRDLKRLQSEHGLQAELQYPDHDAFMKFVAFHNQQWRDAGHGGHFADWRGSAEFYADLADSQQDKHTVWIDRQTGNQGDIAAQFCLVAGQTCQWRLPARSLDQTLNQLSIGKVGLILMIKRLIEHEVTRIEAGVGEYGYKLVYGGQAVPVHRLIVLPDTRRHRARLQCMLIFARGLHLGYYRLWFGRLAVRLRKHVPLPHKPLWASWVRTRI